MVKLSNHTHHRIMMLPTLVGIMSMVLLVDYSSSCRVVAQAAAGRSTNPYWVLAGALNTPRTDHTTTLLPNGKVLVTGGGNCDTDYLASTEIYDPATRTWSYSGNLGEPRREHTATLLPNGKVLVIGGVYGADQLVAGGLYDPTSGNWSSTGAFVAVHKAILLTNGKVFVVGYGYPEIAIYDPATEWWTLVAKPNAVYSDKSVTRLSNGKVLFTGLTMFPNPAAAAEIYDPDTGMWTVTASPNTIRVAPSTVQLASGKVLLLGVDAAHRYRAEIYDPVSGSWSPTRAPNSGIVGPNIMLLPNGKVLVASQNSAETYDPDTGMWNATASPLHRLGYSTPILLSENVLFTGLAVTEGGLDCSPESASSMLFDLGLTQSGTVTNLSAASFGLMGLAGDAIVAGFGVGLATTAAVAATSSPLPTQLAGTTVRIKDGAGDERFAPLFFVSPTQVNYLIPEGTAVGAASVTITSGDGSVSTGLSIIRAVAPSLFAANGTGVGVAAAVALRVKADGSSSYEPIAHFNESQNRFVARPVDLGPEGERVYLVLFGTGIRHRRSLSTVIASIGGTFADVSYAGAQADFYGLDQVNVLLPRSLVGSGETDVLLTVEAQMANVLRVNLK